MKEDLRLTDLISVDVLQRVQDAFSNMTGMAALTADKDGVAVTVGSNFSDFCFKHTRTTELGRQRCEQCDKFGSHLALEQGHSCTYFCHAGLVDFAAPIMADNQLVGCFIGGQVLTSPPDLNLIRETAETLGIDPEDYIEAAQKVRIIDNITLNKAVEFLYVIAGVLSEFAYNSYMLLQSNIEIEKSARAKTDFLANMSHEIRTPMNAILGMAEMALREQMAPAARDCLHQIKASGKNLLVIINDILDFSKIESGKMEILPVAYEPMSMINDIASIVNTRIGTKEIEFTMNVSPDIPDKMLGDNVRIQQILINLPNNAVKFTNKGNIHLDIGCEKLSDDTVELRASVADTGSGIRQEDMGKLFKSFQQVDSKRNRNIEGTGLGLAITKQLLALMGGEISVESECNKGSTFSLKLPQKVVDSAVPVPRTDKKLHVALMIDNPFVKKQVITDLERVGITHTDIAETDDHGGGYDYYIVELPMVDEVAGYFSDSSPSQFIVIADFDGGGCPSLPGAIVIRKPIYYLNLYHALGLINEYIREDMALVEDFRFTAPDAHVLIVDDNHVNLTVAKGLIEPLKMQVDTACSAAETVEVIKKTQYDLIFMDHMMPEVDGIDTTHIIRRMFPTYDNVPIIALTANAIEGTRDMFIEEGMNDFVAKPIDTKEIIAKIKKWLPQEKIVISDKPFEVAEATDSEKPVPEITGLNTKGAMELLGSEKLYWTVLEEYYLNIPRRSETIENLFLEENWKNYTIEVHALKSTSRQIGADDLSSVAAGLEKAGNDGNIPYIRENTANMLKMYRSLSVVLSPLFPDADKPVELKEAEPAKVIELLDALQTALDEFDTLAIDDVIEQMSGYKYDPSFEELFVHLKDAAEASDLDVCSKLVSHCREDMVHVLLSGNM